MVPAFPDAVAEPAAWHPWRVLRDEYPDVEVWHTDQLPQPLLGLTDGATVWLRRAATQAEHRCTLTHEIIHLERGHRGCQPPAIEAAVEREAARRLIPLHALGEALAWATCEIEAADELWVDVPTLRTRLASLIDAERRWLDQRLERHG